MADWRNQFKSHIQHACGSLLNYSQYWRCYEPSRCERISKRLLQYWYSFHSMTCRIHSASLTFTEKKKYCLCMYLMPCHATRVFRATTKIVILSREHLKLHTEIHCVVHDIDCNCFFFLSSLRFASALSLCLRPLLLLLILLVRVTGIWDNCNLLRWCSGK